MDKLLHEVLTQGVKHVHLAFTLVPNGSSTPTISEGDVGGVYITPAYSTTGVWTLTTKNKFLGYVGGFTMLGLHTPAGAHDLVWDDPVQNADGTWTLTLCHFSGGSAADIAAAAGNAIYVLLVFRNSSVKP